MNKNINLQDLAILSAKKSNIEVKEAETFIKELIEIIRKMLLNGDSVRIKNLGTFRRVEVGSRESVDVATGNRVTIPAHHRISFIPDKNLAHAVNEPFALFNPVEIDGHEKPAVKIEEAPAFTDSDSDLGGSIYHSPEKPFRHRQLRNYMRRRLWSTLLCIALGVGLVAFWYYVYILDKSDIETVSPLSDRNAYSVETHDDETLTIKDIVATDSIIVENSAAEGSASQENTDKTTDPTKSYTIRPGDRLTTIALSEYGNKIFWVYLYEENRNSIKNPNIVSVGADIQIPPASKYGIDKGNAESVRKAVELQQKYVNSQIN